MTEFQPLFARIVTLVREKRTDAARELVEATVADSPEFAAQWYILGRLLVSGPPEQRRAIQARLREYGSASELAFRNALDVLEDPHPRPPEAAEIPTSRPTTSVQPAIARLEQFLGRLRFHTLQGRADGAYPPPAAGEGTPDLARNWLANGLLGWPQGRPQGGAP
ncbi:MAG: hypothetical protein HQL82_04990 [Magnetococcales bacterium]|nr:hypothetical protein [Magnetococcales bacterium]